jgi:glycosyltransferase involved in cell wall biosynthesis
MQTVVVYSHLRWNFVYQRPQHLLSRLASRWPIVFIEEPLPGAAADRIEPIDAAPGVTVWRPHVRGSQHGFHPSHQPVLKRLVAEELAAQGITAHWAWLYTPMALAVAQAQAPGGIIYDCMDELSAFGGAPPELLALEDALLRVADVVFTGGRSLYAAKRHRHGNIHCFPSSVDAQHFRPGIADHPLQAGLPTPRLGYCGVIDERMDLALVDGIAATRPEWQLVMVGPTAKIDPAARPQRPNIQWLGQQPYQELPAFINGWDVCLLPFALNESTRYISPTKTLEYMACGKPSVSTAIRDVVEPYGHVVPIRDDVAGFVAACDELLARSPAAASAHAHELADIVRHTSWDRTAEAMARLIQQAQAARRSHQRRPAAAEVGAARVQAVTSAQSTAAAG